MRGFRQVEHDGRELTVVDNDLGSFTVYHGRHDIARFAVSRRLAWRAAWWLIWRCATTPFRLGPRA